MWCCNLMKVAGSVQFNAIYYSYHNENTNQENDNDNTNENDE